MADLKNYQAPVPTIFQKFLWWCCGADKTLMKQSTYSDYAKYAGLGGIVLATGGLAALSMGFAISRIFESPVAAIIIGVIWGVMIFNLDRFIVSSTGKGDGKHDISWPEFVHAIPRILMAALIGITISAPLEVYIFHKEIDKQWEQEIHKVREIAKIKATSELASKTAEANRRLTELKPTLDAFEKQIAELEVQIQNEQARGGRGSKTKDWENSKDRLKAEREPALKEQLKLQTVIDKQDSLILTQEDEAEYKHRGWSAEEIEGVQSGKLDKKKLKNKLGLLDSLVALHNYPGSSWPTWMLRLLFVFIEIAPVFFKLMLAYSAYDYMQDNLKFIKLAQNNIQAKEGYTKLENGEIKDMVVFHEADAEYKNAKDKLDADKLLHEKIVKAYKASEDKNIDDHPEDYIKKG
jgi:Domain of unknown function (DUF4407)